MEGYNTKEKLQESICMKTVPMVCWALHVESETPFNFWFRICDKFHRTQLTPSLRRSHQAKRWFISRARRRQDCMCLLKSQSGHGKKCCCVDVFELSSSRMGGGLQVCSGKGVGWVWVLAAVRTALHIIVSLKPRHYTL